MPSSDCPSPRRIEAPDGRLPDGSIGHLRLNNIDFAGRHRELYLLFFLKNVNAWLGEQRQAW